MVEEDFVVCLFVLASPKRSFTKRRQLSLIVVPVVDLKTFISQVYMWWKLAATSRWPAKKSFQLVSANLLIWLCFYKLVPGVTDNTETIKDHQAGRRGPWLELCVAFDTQTKGSDTWSRKKKDEVQITSPSPLTKAGVTDESRLHWMGSPKEKTINRASLAFLLVCRLVKSVHLIKNCSAKALSHMYPNKRTNLLIIHKQQTQV